MVPQASIDPTDPADARPCRGLLICFSCGGWIVVGWANVKFEGGFTAISGSPRDTFPRIPDMSSTPSSSCTFSPKTQRAGPRVTCGVTKIAADKFDWRP